EPAQDIHRGRHHLDAGADAREAGSRLVDLRIEAREPQRGRGGEPAYSGADDRDRGFRGPHVLKRVSAFASPLILRIRDQTTKRTKFTKCTKKIILLHVGRVGQVGQVGRAGGGGERGREGRVGRG